MQKIQFLPAEMQNSEDLWVIKVLFNHFKCVYIRINIYAQSYINKHNTGILKNIFDGNEDYIKLV